MKILLENGQKDMLVKYRIYINELNDRNTLKKSKEYCNKFQKFCEDLFRKNEQILNGSNRIQKNNAETLVNDIAKITINGKDKYFYSFATKYCSHHFPIIFPIIHGFPSVALPSIIPSTPVYSNILLASSTFFISPFPNYWNAYTFFYLFYNI